jgi:mono/diheme cytochrome c family protein
MALLRILAIVAVICIAAVAGLAMSAWHSAIAPIARPGANAFNAGQIERGAELAALGDCSTCHTVPGGRPFAGGYGVPTPFGTVYSTNITPDETTGIGRWSEAAFRRALRQGVDRDGRELYPAFPYDHFTLLADDDISALYAFFMTRQAVAATAPANDLPFPLNIRMTVAGWKLLFFRAGAFRADPNKDQRWNRGAYLIEGIGHCGACHTPRNALGAEDAKNAFGGGEAEGWTAYALNASSPAPVPWNVDALRTYLRNGWHSDHGVARGPMAPVIRDLAVVAEADVAAMSAYMADVAGSPTPERQRAAAALIARVRTTPSLEAPGGTAAGPQDAGALIYQSTCATCHDSGRSLPYGGINLALSTGPSGPNARNVINVVLWGLPAASGERSPIMPGFANVLNDGQLADLLRYVRAHFSDKPPWTRIDDDVRTARSNAPRVNVSPAPGADPVAAADTGHEAQR